MNIKYLHALYRNLVVTDIEVVRLYILDNGGFLLLTEDDVVKEQANTCLPCREMHIYIDIPQLDGHLGRGENEATDMEAVESEKIADVHVDMEETDRDVIIGM